MSVRCTAVRRDLDTSVQLSPLSGDLSAANVCLALAPTRAATDELLTLPWPLLPRPGFVVSAGTHGLTDALVSTDAARRDDACPDAAGLLSLLDASKWLRRPRRGAVRLTPLLASAFLLVLLIQIVVQIVQIKS